jgi:hypothetical protein
MLFDRIDKCRPENDVNLYKVFNTKYKKYIGLAENTFLIRKQI